MRILRTFLLAFPGLGLGLPWLFPSAGGAQPGAVFEVGIFSAAEAGGGFPAGWKPLAFKNIDKTTLYTLVEDGGRVVVKAESHGAASGLVREVQVDPREFPILQWRWKAANLLQKGDVRRKEGDDYPARLYITFEYDPGRLSFWERFLYRAVKLLYGQAPPLRALNYIWANAAPLGLVVPNPYTDWAMMIVVQSGPEKLNRWVEEERDVYRDYRKAFGEEPGKISGVAVMTDTDNTGESAVAYYGDIVLKKAGSGRE